MSGAPTPQLQASPVAGPFYCSVQLSPVAAPQPPPPPHPLQGELPLLGVTLGSGPSLQSAPLSGCWVLPAHHWLWLAIKGHHHPELWVTVPASICQLMPLLPEVCRGGGFGLPRHPGWD